MRFIPAVLALLLAAPSALTAQRVVEPNGCAGNEVARKDILLIDVSESLDIEKAIQEAIEKYHLKVVKKRVVETEAAVSMAGAFRKAARIAGKERCDAVLVVAKGVGREQETALLAGPGGFSGYSLPDADEWVAAIFADIEVTNN